jgi:hypothetical protein
MEATATPNTTEGDTAPRAPLFTGWSPVGLWRNDGRLYTVRDRALIAIYPEREDPYSWMRPW